MTYNPWEIVVVPFPFVENNQSKPRPVVVLSSPEFQEKNDHIVVGMITTAQNTNWKDDIFLQNIVESGLSVPSVFRPKIFTLPLSLVKKKIGKLSEKDQKTIEKFASQNFF